ncbi:MAG: TonB-dependent receptor [Acidobacteriota bacterium]
MSDAAKRCLPVLVLCCLVFAVAWPARAQSNTTSALAGVVVDETGAALPGATVEAKSDDALGTRSAQTDAAGKFRFAQVPPGVYAVSVTLEGFQPTRIEGLRLQLGQTTELPVKLSIAKVEESLVVVGEATAVDATSSATSTNLSNEYLQNMPTSRFQPAVLNLAPGVNMDSAYGGAEGSANSYQIDGVDVSDPDGGTPWAFFNFNLIKEVQLVGLGAPAEYGQFTGVVFNSVTQSGGNKLHGMVEGNYTNDALTSDNSNIPNLNPTTKKSIDTTVQFGGPLITDKLWYFVSGQYLADDSSSGGPVGTERDPRIFAKLNTQPNESTTLDFWGEWDRYDITGRGGDAFTPLAATVREKAPETVWNVNWQSLLSQNTVLNVTESGYTGYYYLDPENGYDIAGHLDSGSGLHSVNSLYYYKADRTRNQLNASVSHHAADFIKGDHDFKFGMEIERSTVRNRYGYTTGTWFYDNYGTAYDPGVPDSYDLVPYSLTYSGGSYDVHARNERLSVYAQDSWRIGDRFTINPGVRADLDRGHVRSGTVYSANPVAPRIGFAWDPMGNGKTVIKGHFGQYYEALFGSHYYWVDPGAFTGGEIGRLFPSGYTDVISETAGSRYAIDRNMKHPYVEQELIGVDRELTPGIVMSATYVHRRNKNLIETVSRDGVFVPVTGEVAVIDPKTGDYVGTGQQVTLFDYLNPGEDTLIVTNPKGLYRKYDGFIFTVNRRLKDNWQMLVSYVYSKTRGNIDNLDGFNSAYGGNNPGGFLNTPNSLINADGRLTHDQTNQVKLQGSYFLRKLDLVFSGNFTYYSGDTWNPRTTCLLMPPDEDGVRSCHDFPQGSVRYFAETRGSRRLPAARQLDLRVEWTHALGGGQLGLVLDAFNLTNQGRATVVEDRVNNAAFGQPSSFNSPRQLRLGARYTW